MRVKGGETKEIARSWNMKNEGKKEGEGEGRGRERF